MTDKQKFKPEDKVLLVDGYSINSDQRMFLGKVLTIKDMYHEDEENDSQYYSVREFSGGNLDTELIAAETYKNEVGQELLKEAKL